MGRIAKGLQKWLKQKLYKIISAYFKVVCKYLFYFCFYVIEYNFPICAYPVPCVFLLKSLTGDPTLCPLPVPDLKLFFCMCV